MIATFTEDLQLFLALP